MADPLPPNSAPPASSHSSSAKSQARGSNGQFTKPGTNPASNSSIPDLVDFKISNPVTYLKAWWKKVMANEGIDFRFRVHPVTAVLIAVLILGGSYSLGFITRSLPFLSSLIPSPSPIATLLPSGPTPSPDNDYIETAISGTLKYTASSGKYYLLTGSSQAISLENNSQINLSKFIDQKVLVSGSYSAKTHDMKVSDILSLESPTPAPTVVPVQTP